MGNAGYLLLVMAGVLVINAIVTGLVWYRHRVPFYRSMFGVWVTLILSSVMQGLVHSEVWMPLAFGGTTFLINLMMADALGRALELGSRWRRHLMALGLLSATFFALTWRGAPFWARSLPMAVAAATPLLDLLWRATRRGWRSLSVTARSSLFAAALFALHNLDYPFLRNRPSFATLGFVLAILSVFALSITTPTILLERIALENERLLQEARRAVGVRDEFLLVASHELRTPLASLRLVIQGLASGKILPTPERLARTLPLLERQSARVSSLVEEMLDIGRLSKPVELQRRAESLTALVRDVAKSFEEPARRSATPLRVHLPDDALVGEWDRTKLEQVVTNLLSNALKFGAGKPVALLVERAGGATARLCVRDEGIGIPADRLPHIFERFERAVSTREYGGMGLGLYIVRSLVEAHGGRVHVESRLGAGTHICVELPLRAAQSESEPAEPHATKHHPEALQADR